jgi:hypothetical protein
MFMKLSRLLAIARVMAHHEQVKKQFLCGKQVLAGI